MTFLASLARAAQGKHGNVRIAARSYGTAKTQLPSSVQLFLSMLMLSSFFAQYAFIAAAVCLFQRLCCNSR
jgi:hypothetical protein